MMTEGEEGKAPLRVFISYARADKETARKLRRLISQYPRVRVVTADELSTGEDWDSQLQRELDACDVFIVLLTLSAVESAWVLRELGAAWGLRKPIIGVYTHSSVISMIPVSLSSEQAVDIKELENPEFVSQTLQRYEKAAV